MPRAIPRQNRIHDQRAMTTISQCRLLHDINIQLHPQNVREPSPLSPHHWHEVFHRTQEQQLQREAFYFYRSKFERRFHFEMEGNKTYSIRLESWATEPDALARTIGGAVIQGSGVRSFESVDVPTQIQRAADTAAKADIALVFKGTTNEFESEGYDRETMDLTADQYKLISAVSAQNRNTVIVNYSGSPVNMVTFVDDVAAILQCSFPGQEAGHSMLES